MEIENKARIMAITEREFLSLQKSIDDNHKAVMDMLKMRKDYWDERIDKICNTVTDMKKHCERQQDQCSIVFRDFDKRIDQNSTDVTKIKTIGSVLMVIWGALVSIAGHVMRKL
jgi:hypothetical protein